jgi:ADP-dependent NAD(P)H-hydrate dehydratase / NAD(P)H-hydrate epimerase
VRPILTPEQSAELDRRSAERGVSVDALMENAGAAVARAVLRMAGGSYGKRVAVVCGKGNNGGDGLVAARHLHRRGFGVTVVMVADPSTLRDAAAVNFERYARSGGRWSRFDRDLLAREAGRADVAVDAVFGTGFRGEPKAEWRAAIEALRAATAPVVAVDIPSGVEGETGAVRGAAVRAVVTVTFGALKPGVVFFPGADLAGDVEVEDIGFPPDLVLSDLSLVEASDVAGWLRPRGPESHKRESGYVLVLAGSRAMTGAAVLAASSAYRAGAGLVTIAVPEGILGVVEGSITEATFLPLPETKGGAVSEEAWPVLREPLDAVGAAALGPGLTTDPSTVALVRRVVREAPVPLVIDADGLNAFADEPSLLAERASPAVLTPHAGEFARLTGLASKEVVEDRVGHARKAAAGFRATVLLKGSRTVIAEPGGRAFVNPTGGSYLATGGTGDVLTGAVGAFLARGLDAADAAAAGAFVHGLAGRMAAERLGEGVVASDVVAHLAHAVLAVRPGHGAA